MDRVSLHGTPYACRFLQLDMFIGEPCSAKICNKKLKTKEEINFDHRKSGPRTQNDLLFFFRKSRLAPIALLIPLNASRFMEINW